MAWSASSARPACRTNFASASAADIRAVIAADPLIGDRLAATGQILNVGGPAEFAQATEEQTREDRGDCQRPRHQADAVIKPMQ
jgi:hypothetical protein